MTLLLSLGADVSVELDCYFEGEWSKMKAYELALALGFANVVKAFLDFYNEKEEIGGFWKKLCNGVWRFGEG